MRLDVQEVSWSPDKVRKILDSIELHARPGEFVGIIGPNGSGKSSLLRCMYRALRPDSGAVLLDGRDVRQLKSQEAAAMMAVVLQETATEFDFTVIEIVLMGRHPHKMAMERFTEQDLALAQNALRRVGMIELQTRPFATLSEGEKQRTLVAWALAQQARFLILDEPTNHLDIRYCLEILETVRQLGVTTVAVLHDLNLAGMFCETLLVLHRGKVRAHGPPAEVLTPRLIHEVFGVGSLVRPHPVTGRPSILFFPMNAGQPEDAILRQSAATNRGNDHEC
ncbi:MAG: ABC transporter ATP-binding protein [Syntrophobacteraceae bacterium]